MKERGGRGRGRGRGRSHAAEEGEGLASDHSFAFKEGKMIVGARGAERRGRKTDWEEWTQWEAEARGREETRNSNISFQSLDWMCAVNRFDDSSC